MPLWYKLSRRYNKKTSWMISMTGSVIGFIWATFLGLGDYISYGFICVITGICLGGDFSMPASLLSDLLQKSTNKGKYFGVWGMLGKSSIAIAGSLGLFALGIMGYVPGETPTDDIRFSISISYALIPCFIKLISLICLSVMSIDTPNNGSRRNHEQNF
jgi:Na+/melibiose symporter-like transporter